MTSARFDIAIIGLGAVGGGALLAAARAGARVLGLDRHTPPHALGSTHGETRIVRAAIGEGAVYTPFALRNFELLDLLAAETGETLVDRCGLLLLGGGLPHATHVPEGFFATTLAAARSFDIAHEILDAAAVRQRFPAYATFDGPQAYYEPGAGMGYPERVVAAQIRRASALGAEVRLATPVLGIAGDGAGVAIRTAEGTIKADRAIVAAGAWTPGFLPPGLARGLTVTRQVLHWFAPPATGSAHDPRNMPTFIWNDLYGFPVAVPGGGVKVATESMSAVVDPDVARAPVNAEDLQAVLPRVRQAFPQLGAHLRSATCLYTSTADGHFRFGPHPDMPRVHVVSACSGHGFKHAAAVGEAAVAAALGRHGLAFPPSWRWSPAA